MSNVSEPFGNTRYCGLTMDPDQNAAVNIKNLAVGIPVSSKAQSRTEAQAGAAEKLQPCDSFPVKSQEFPRTPRYKQEFG